MPCDVGRLPVKGEALMGMEGCGRRRDKTETGMEQGMWVYMAAAVGAG